MAKHVNLKTRADLIAMVEKTVTAILKKGELVERAGTVINAIQCARAILADSDIDELRARVDAMEQGYVEARPTSTEAGQAPAPEPETG